MDRLSAYGKGSKSFVQCMGFHTTRSRHMLFLGRVADTKFIGYHLGGNDMENPFGKNTVIKFIIAAVSLGAIIGWVVLEIIRYLSS